MASGAGLCYNPLERKGGRALLFQKDIEPRCTYCSRGTQLDEEKILCPKRGLVSPGEHCRSFRYDPLKRVPPVPAAPDFSRLRDEDFSL